MSKRLLNLISTTVVCLFCMLTSYSSFAVDKSPKETIAETLSEIVAVVGKYPSEKDSKDRLDKLRTLIEPRFDFKEMSKRSLGPNWSTITEEQRARFIELFSDLLANTYLSRIETVKKDMVSVDSEKIYPATSGKAFASALVKTSVSIKDDTFPLDYKLVKRSTGWQAYDVIIENIGLVSNYRNEFSGILRKEGFDGLIKLLESKQKDNSNR
jgi:phospholipid transport system substrate-binding protein